MRKTIAVTAVGTALLAGTLLGVLNSDAASPAENYRSELNHTADHMKDPGGEPFLPVYLAMLQGKPAPGQSDCPPAHATKEDPTGLRSLLIPCDVGGTP